jgi:hypothetical protein
MTLMTWVVFCVPPSATDVTASPTVVDFSLLESRPDIRGVLGTEVYDSFRGPGRYMRIVGTGG